MAKILFECADEDKALWVESAASERLSLSAWIRRVLAERQQGGALKERGPATAELSGKPTLGVEASSPRSLSAPPVLAEREKTATVVQVDSRNVTSSESVSSRSASIRTDFKKPGQKKKAR